MQSYFVITKKKHLINKEKNIKLCGRKNNNSKAIEMEMQIIYSWWNHIEIIKHYFLMYKSWILGGNASINLKSYTINVQ